MDVEPRRGGAVLAAVGERADDRALGGGLQVGVVEDDERRLAAELHVHALDGLGGVAHHRAPVRVEPVTEISPRPGGGRARRPPRAGAGDDVEDPGREAGLEREAAEHQRGQRRQLGGLEDDGVAGGERRADLPRGHVERVVPGRDRGADAERLAPDRARCSPRGTRPRPCPRGCGRRRRRSAGCRSSAGGRTRSRTSAACPCSATRARELVRALLEQAGHAVDTAARSPGVMRLQSPRRKAALAAATARSASSAEASATSASGSPVAGLRWCASAQMATSSPSIRSAGPARCQLMDT